MSDKSFLGFKVQGDTYHGYRDAVEQLTEPEVDALFAAVIGQRGVRGIAWSQYTPYFNDGEPCTFGVGEFYFAIEGAEMDEDSRYYDYGWMEDDAEENGRHWVSTYNTEFKRLVGERKHNWVAGGKSTYTDEPSNPVLYYPIFALLAAVGQGKANNVLLGKFGDHCRVLIDVEAQVVSVDEYDHD